MNDRPPRTHFLPFGEDPIFFALALVVFATAMFLLVPSLDIGFSRLFYDPEVGFRLSSDPWLRRVRDLSEIIVWTAVIVCIALIAVKLAAVEPPSLMSPRITLFLLSTLAIGPGLLINGLLKNNWGRPRPRSIEAFGGDLPYVSVWNISDGFDGNHSFVSGEASSAIWVTALALVVPRDLRLPVLAVTIPFALAASLGRVAFGGHFLSDVLISWGLTLTVIFIAHILFFQRPPHGLSEAGLEDWLTRVSRRFRAGGVWAWQRTAAEWQRRTRS